MNEDKQIEEMAKVIKCDANTSLECPETTCGVCRAKRLYNAGYRKQREGKWKKSAHGKYDYFCSACGVKAMSRCYGNHDDLTKFCPHCGAKMKGGD